MGKKTKKTRAPKPLGDVAIVTLILHRATGRVEIEQELSTPAETYAMTLRAAQMIEETANLEEA